MKTMYSLLLSALGLLAVGATTGCLSSTRGDVYARGQARAAHVTRPATVVTVRAVTIEGSDGVVGAIGGGVLGAVIGNTIGGGSGRTVAQVGGALGGAAAGAALEGAVTKRSGLEITVQYDDGSQMAIVQAISPNESFFPGQRVSVLVDAMGVHRVRP